MMSHAPNQSSINNQLVIRNMTHGFDSPAGQYVSIFERIDLEMTQGDCLALIGPSGSGKSTLIHLIAGLDQPIEGDIFWEGKNISRLSDKERSEWRLQNVGLIYQDFRLFNHLTALENVCFPLELLGMSRQQAKSIGQELLENVELAHRANHTPPKLSGGEKQRVAIARALVHAPPLLLADEPTGNLDHRSAHHISTLLFNLQKIKGTTLLLVTHDRQLAQRANRCCMVQNGSIEPYAPKSTENQNYSL